MRKNITKTQKTINSRKKVALIFLMESVLGTIWVWLVINEIPPMNTIIGGVILLISVSIFIIKTTKFKN